MTFLDIALDDESKLVLFLENYTFLLDMDLNYSSWK